MPIPYEPDEVIGMANGNCCANDPFSANFQRFGESSTTALTPQDDANRSPRKDLR